MIAMQSVCEDRLHKSQVGAVVARQVHVLEVADSNSAPATLIFQVMQNKVISFQLLSKGILFVRIACLLKWFYGVTVAQQILVLLETVRFSLELPPLKYYCYFNLCASACESSSALFIVYFFQVFFIYDFKILYLNCL